MPQREASPALAEARLKILRGLEELGRQRLECLERRDEAIGKARAVDLSLSRIGKAVGLSNQGVKLRADSLPAVYEYAGNDIAQVRDEILNELRSIGAEMTFLDDRRKEAMAVARGLGLTFPVIGGAIGLHPKTVQTTLRGLDYIYEPDESLVHEDEERTARAHLSPVRHSALPMVG